MKRKLAFFLAMVMMLCLTACGGEDVKSTHKNSDKDSKKTKDSHSAIVTAVSLVEVPRFIGVMYYEVDYGQNFDLKFQWEDAHDPDVKKGEIFRQDPAAGKSVYKGTTVTLYVNNATPKDIQLDVRVTAEGMHKNDMRKLLVDAGFGVKEIINSSATIAADHVIGINITPGHAYPYGTEVTMVVSSGPSQLPPIEFPTMIIGEDEATAEAILRSHGFKGQVVFVGVNYTDEQFATKGTVMGVATNGVLDSTLPTQIDAAGMLTLAVSNGLKNVPVELDWPTNLDGTPINKQFNVSVIVNGTPMDSLTAQYAPGYNPSFSEEKLTFTLTTHPSESAYYVSVNLKETSSTQYKEYVRLLVNPVEGTWTIVGDYQSLPGISAEA